MFKLVHIKIYCIFVSIFLLSSCHDNSATISEINPMKAETKVIVTNDNFVTAKTDRQMQKYVKRFSAFGKFFHSRWMYDLNNQDTKHVNLDTLYSYAIVDLTTPLDITMPETHGKYQSLMVVNQSHSITAYYAGKYTLTKSEVGSRYAFLVIRTFIDHTDKESLLIAHKLQDSVLLKQESIGEFSVPEYDEESFAKVNEKILLTELDKDQLLEGYGQASKVDPEKNRYSAAFSWGGLPQKYAMYIFGNIKNDDGVTPHSLTVNDVPVDAFWSISIYNKRGYYEISDKAVYSINSTRLKKNVDGSITINFGNSGAINNLNIFKKWHYVVRLYKPQASLIDKQWHFPSAEEIN
ncbi:DUF1214 domain-containing protein [Thalassotalea psychrophila]|uniref:DUF1214 domain-containing protein n=1 Tax=Thalassotalea psychrophila TaxID=3065647 RepID=A0ABY9TYC6_9GAMM|nr:DUF1214 domain-containing protein [Colwelliaceae bacterium SQ149]